MEALALLAPLLTFAVVVVGALGLYGYATGNRRLLHNRLRAYGGSVGSTFAATPHSGILRERRFSDIATLERLLDGRGFAAKIAAELHGASVPLRVGEYLLIRWFMGCFLLVFGLSIDLPLVAGGVLGVVGFYLPKLWVMRLRALRLRRFDDQLVDALTMMANALKSGASFLQAMEMVARELPAPVGEEFGQVVAEIGVGAPVEAALRSLGERIQSYDLYLIITAIVVQRTVGGNLSEVLENIAHTIRERMRLLREVQVKTAEQRLSAYIVGALPLFLLVLFSFTNKEYVDVMLFTPTGRLLTGFAFGLDVLGFLILRKLTEIEV